MKWIKVTDRLPIINDQIFWVLIIDKDNEITIARYRRYETGKYVNNKYNKFVVYDWVYEAEQDKYSSPEPIFWCDLDDIPRPEIKP